MSDPPLDPFGLRPGAVVLRRGAGTAQIGLDPAHALLVRGLDPDALHALRALDPGSGVPDGPALPGPLTAALRAAGLTRTHTPAPTHRADATVAVLGTSRVAAAVAVGLAYAGVGTVVVAGSSRTVRPRDLWPGGPEAPDVGSVWTDAIAGRVRRWGARTSDPGPPTLAVLTGTVDADLPWIDPAEGDRWLRAGVEHLWAAAAGESGVVTATVRPGVSACLHCRELTHAGVDLGWPVARADLCGRPGAVGDPSAVSSAVTAVVASMTLARVLHRLDTPEGPGPADDLLIGPDGGPTARPTAPHPECGCRWPGTPVMMDR